MQRRAFLGALVGAAAGAVLPRTAMAATPGELLFEQRKIGVFIDALHRDLLDNFEDPNETLAAYATVGKRVYDGLTLMQVPLRQLDGDIRAMRATDIALGREIYGVFERLVDYYNTERDVIRDTVNLAAAGARAGRIAAILYGQDRDLARSAFVAAFNPMAERFDLERLD
jgi:hypothetical protein